MNNPMPPPRPFVMALAGLEKEAEEYTFREAVEWHKNIVRQLSGKATPIGAEEQALQQSWVHLIEGIAKREGIPSGFLSYMLDQLAQAELQLAATAEAEFEQAAVAP